MKRLALLVVVCGLGCSEAGTVTIDFDPPDAGVDAPCVASPEKGDDGCVEDAGQ